MKNIKYIGKITDEELAVLKAKHCYVYILEVPANDEGTEVSVGYLHKPDRILMGAVLNKIKTNSISAKEMLLNATWIGGDERIKTDDDLFYSACTVLDGFFEVRKSELKKN